MAIKKYKPTSPGRRDMTGIDYSKSLTGDAPHEPLLIGRKRHVGRANSGRISVRHKGSGHKRRYRIMDFMRSKFDIPARIETIEYDPNRTAFISLVVYADGERRYILAPKGIKKGDTIITATKEAALTPGNRMPLQAIPVGTFVYNVELKPKGGGKLGRSAGTYIQVSAHDEGKASLKMPSTEVRKVSDQCYATVGEVTNSDHKLVKLGKAGRSRWMGIRPTVRGSAMNPVDHPHGGGEGKQGIGLRRGPKTRQGKLAYGVKTRRKKKYSRNSIVTRRKTQR
ncbi:MAG: large subunit ribosomal protein L2 [Planctomycetota bacterium]|jgi:large subunit ribosomal protein L2